MIKCSWRGKKTEELDKTPVQSAVCDFDHVTLSSLPRASVTTDMGLDLPVTQLTQHAVETTVCELGKGSHTPLPSVGFQS